MNKLMPALILSANSDAAIKKQEDEQCKILHRAEIDSFVKRKETHQANKGKAFAFLFGQCNKAMQQKLQARSNCETTIKGDPFKLLKAIEEHSMSHQENKCDVSIVFDSIRNLINVKQKDEESPTDHTR